MREKRLIDYSLRKYIIASVMSMAVSTVNNVMDAFLMGKNERR